MLGELVGKLQKPPGASMAPSSFKTRLPRRSRKRSPAVELRVFRKLGRQKPRGSVGLWLAAGERAQMPKGLVARLWWWLPPVIWPDNEAEINRAVVLILKKGGRNFVLNAPWQTALFNRPKGLNLWAGPFCNIANPLAVHSLSALGIRGVIVSPELGRKDALVLPKHSSLPVGIVISGNWPLCVSRASSDSLKTEKPFFSPKGEGGWVRKYGSDYWVYPNWKLDLKAKQHDLQRAGYTFFVHLVEPLPRSVKMKKRPGLWNWDVNLL
jgi:putative protease